MDQGESHWEKPPELAHFKLNNPLSEEGSSGHDLVTWASHGDLDRPQQPPRISGAGNLLTQKHPSKLVQDLTQNRLARPQIRHPPQLAQDLPQNQLGRIQTQDPHQLAQDLPQKRQRVQDHTSQLFDNDQHQIVLHHNGLKPQISDKLFDAGSGFIYPGTYYAGHYGNQVPATYPFVYGHPAHQPHLPNDLSDKYILSDNTTFFSIELKQTTGNVFTDAYNTLENIYINYIKDYMSTVLEAFIQEILFGVIKATGWTIVGSFIVMVGVILQYYSDQLSREGFGSYPTSSTTTTTTTESPVIDGGDSSSGGGGSGPLLRLVQDNPNALEFATAIAFDKNSGNFIRRNGYKYQNKPWNNVHKPWSKIDINQNQDKKQVRRKPNDEKNGLKGSWDWITSAIPFL